MNSKDHRLDKLGLFILAGLSIGGLIGLGAAVLLHGIPTKGEGSEGLLNVIATGLLLFSREIVGAIRAAWTDQQVGSMTEKLHSSQPTDTLVLDQPMPVEVVNSPDKPANVLEAKP